jgi:hypothetical protein
MSVISSGVGSGDGISPGTSPVNMIYKHFNEKYPSLIKASGLTTETIQKIVSSVVKRDGKMTNQNLQQILGIIDGKFKSASNSDNRVHNQFNITGMKNDPDTKISQETYLKNFNTKLSGSDINNMTNLNTNNTKDISGSSGSSGGSSANIGFVPDIVSSSKAEKSAHNSTTYSGIGANSASAYSSTETPQKPPSDDNPFNENFPSRNRSKDVDMLLPEVREFDYYVMVDSKDRDRTQNIKPNEFIIHFAPYQNSGSSGAPVGYVDRAFGNVKSCEITDIIILDSSNQPDSSDSGTTTYPYLLLKIPEIGNNYFGTNNDITSSFAILTDYNKIGDYKYYNIAGVGSNYAISKIFNPRINLSKLTISLLLPDGTPFNFGEANNDNIKTVIKIGFRITIIQKNLATQFVNKNT